MIDTNLKYTKLQKDKESIDNRLKEIAELNTQGVLDRKLRKECTSLRKKSEILSLKIVIEGAKQGLFRLER